MQSIAINKEHKKLHLFGYLYYLHTKTNPDIDGSQCTEFACKSLKDTSQRLDNDIAGEKINFQIGVIVLLDNITRDKYLNTTESPEFSEDINLSHVFFKLYRQAINLNFNILSKILTHSMCNFVI